MIKRLPVRAILFDAAGTLIHLRESVGEGYARVARRHGFALDPPATEASFRSAWQRMPPLGSALGPAGDRSEKNWWREIVDQVLDSFPDLVVDDRGAFFEELFASYAKPEAWRPYPEVGEVLEALKNHGLRLFVLSNFDSRLLAVLAGLGLADYFEKIFYSGAIGHAKPSPEAFQHALEAVGLPADQCLHAGDDPVCDWKGASEAGLQAFELDRSQHDLRLLKNLPGMPDFSD